ncbi:Vps36-domain-containing protein [Ramicandelaber brevisporus]|nr:Vps36-domain-containing protein [Ramicandelaber brevisporus]
MNEAVELLDLTFSLRPVLRDGETAICQQGGVGLYDGNAKSANHQNGVVHLTTERLLYVNNDNARKHSISLELTNIREHSMAPGFLTQSAKITLAVKRRRRHTTDGDEGEETIAAAEGLLDWTCAICDHVNSAKITVKCALCGVPKTPAKKPHQRDPYDDEYIASNKQPQSEIACPVCTFLNHPSMVYCEVCEAKLLGKDLTHTLPPATLSQQQQAQQQQHHTGNSVTLKIAFRSGGHAQFYDALKQALTEVTQRRSSKSTLATAATSSASSSSALSSSSTLAKPASDSSSTATRKSALSQAATLDSAFSDLDALNEKASELIGLAETLSTRIRHTSSRATISPATDRHSGDTRHSASTGNDEGDHDGHEYAKLKTYLQDLGIDNPVTRDTAGSSNYIQELAKELAEVLINVIDRFGGHIPLVDAYCLFNRARGTAIVSPEDVRRACDMFSSLKLPLRLRTFESGFVVIQQISQSDDDTAVVLASYIESLGNMTAMEMSIITEQPIYLVTEQLRMAEKMGLLCRDESVEGIRFYTNLISQAV